MPAPVPADARNKKLLTALFWGGVALAPVAALILLVADGNGPLRFAAVLAIMAVVLIGLSIALKTEGDGSVQGEELREELEELRRELRGEIVAAAQRGNQALDEARRVQEALAGLRPRLDAGAAQLAGADEAPGPGRARVSAPAPEAPPRYAERPAGAAGTYGAARVAEPAAGEYGGAPAGEPDAAAAGGLHDERLASRGGDDRPTGYGADRPAGTAGVYGAANRQEADNRSGDQAHRPHGVVRHTETVHVTTRHTVVDGGVGESGGRYGGYGTSWQEERSRGGHAAERDDRSWSDADERSRRGESRSWSAPPGREEERPWSGAARADDRPRSGRAREEDASWSEPHHERSWPGSRDDRAGHRDDRAAYRDEYTGYRDDRETGRDDRGRDGDAAWREAAPEAPAASRTARPDDTGEYWAQMRAGDRWAAVRDDDQGRELRVGERRAEVHADQTGAEYRMQDRWASVRQDEPRRGGARDETWQEGWREPEAQPALPPGGVPVPQEWRPPRQHGHQPEPVRGRPEPEPYGRRRQAEEPGYDRQGYEADRDRWR
ncbi:hypothetical protein [Micromonospora craniellae]|uniref:Uncharacterized protein n=1 Tax=Micromonospora craniellae TaxID=2294034 RepID=A0A372G294_9ACTN|nr:hypothetical protein [Micromonospora craniellae]QOC89984.1 hypothetical protein ID554_17345 [Micromonospora craniellae]RFS47132.1 hypothetical protein D0Q02_08255 [Micromonospora craniellae]